MRKNILFLVLGILLIGIVGATTTCCEKTTGSNPAWCQNVNDPNLCDSTTNPITGQPYRAVSSFCEATSYCKLGTCINQQEGICLSAPQIVCQKNTGYWSSSSPNNLPQCALGCCLVGDQAAFVTQVRCNKLASQYGLDVNFRADISDEITCLSSANPGAEGACVYSDTGITRCERTTRKECQDKQKSSQSDYSFHEGFLCSAQDLNSICGSSCVKNGLGQLDCKTRCEGDDVYFVDTCGNLANIYVSSLAENENYWTLIQDPPTNASGCNGAGNTNSQTCGDCDYFSGSMCSDKGTRSVDYGNYICKSLDCKDYTGPFSLAGDGTGKSKPTITNGKTNYPKHGDTWCATDNRSIGKSDSPGSSSFRLICYNGDVTVEECGSGVSGGTRQMICAENKTTRVGNCKVNIWEDCTSQKTSGDCNNINLRDCTWLTIKKDNSGDKICSTPDSFNWAPSAIKALFSMWTSNCEDDIYGFSDFGLTENSSMSGASGACVPKYAPGFERDGSDTATGGEICAQAQSSCLVTYEKMGIIFSSGWQCINNCACGTKAWAEGLNNISKQLGDCGVKNNYIGDAGVNTISNSVKIQKCSGGSKREGC